VPRPETLDGAIIFNDPKSVIDFLNKAPDRGEVNAIELGSSNGVLTAVAHSFPELIKLETPAAFAGSPELAMNKSILLRMLKLGYETVKFGSRDYAPILAEGGMGVFVAMPVKIAKKLNATAAPINPEVDGKAPEVPKNFDTTKNPRDRVFDSGDGCLRSADNDSQRQSGTGLYHPGGRTGRDPELRRPHGVAEVQTAPPRRVRGADAMELAERVHRGLQGSIIPLLIADCKSRNRLHPMFVFPRLKSCPTRDYLNFAFVNNQHKNSCSWIRSWKVGAKSHAN